MANYSLVINSRFNPFTYQELMAPVQQSTTAHQEIENAYGDMAAKADVWKGIADRESDPAAYRMYEKYSQDLAQSAGELMRNGLNPSSRNSMYNMYRRYSSEIKPLETAYANKVADIKMQQELSAKDPSLMWDTSARSVSLDSYLNGKTPEYYNVSGDDLYKRAMKGANTISSRYFKTAEGRAFQNQYFKYVTEQGLSPQEAILVLQNDPKYKNDFGKLIEDITGSSNISRLSPQDQERAMMRVMEGINAGILYDQKEEFKEDWMAKEAFRYSLQRKAAQEEAAQVNQSGKYFEYLPSEINHELSESAKQINDDMQILQNIMKVYPDGNIPKSSMDVRVQPSMYGQAMVYQKPTNVYGEQYAKLVERYAGNNPRITGNVDYDTLQKLMEHKALNNVVLNNWSRANDTTGELTMRYIGPRLASGVDFDKKKMSMNAIWTKNKRGKKTYVDPDIAQKVLSSGDISLQINPIEHNGDILRAYDPSTNQTYYINPHVLDDLSVSFRDGDGNIRAMKFNDNGSSANTVVGTLRGMYDYGVDPSEISVAADNLMDATWRALRANVNSMQQDIPKTSSKNVNYYSY